MKSKNNNEYGVLYLRYSSHGQSEQSIEGQITENMKYAEREGITIINKYVDRAISGTRDNRPAFQQMINDEKQGKFSYVIVYRLDRFARNRYDIIYINMNYGNME